MAVSRVLPLGVVIAGLLGMALLLLVPVRASFGDDPILRLQGFDRQRSFQPTTVGCGAAPSNLVAPVATGTLYDIARNDACHRAGVRRTWIAVATAAAMVVAGLAGIVLVGQRE
jgi:hypothetical protein